jgi:hypothetical protein
LILLSLSLFPVFFFLYLPVILSLATASPIESSSPSVVDPGY